MCFRAAANQEAKVGAFPRMEGFQEIQQPFALGAFIQRIHDDINAPFEEVDQREQSPG